MWTDKKVVKGTTFDHSGDGTLHDTQPVEGHPNVYPYVTFHSLERASCGLELRDDKGGYIDDIGVEDTTFDPSTIAPLIDLNNAIETFKSGAFNKGTIEEYPFVEVQNNNEWESLLAAARESVLQVVDTDFEGAGVYDLRDFSKHADSVQEYEQEGMDFWADDILEGMFQGDEWKTSLQTLLDRNKEGNQTTANKLSGDAQSWISHKIKLLRDEGKSEKQAAAIAYSMAREEGYDVPKRKAAFTGDVRDFMSYLEGTLIPDLKTSGKVATAEDFETVLHFLGGSETLGEYNTVGDFIDYLQNTLIPDLANDLQTAIVEDLETAIKFMNEVRYGTEVHASELKNIVIEAMGYTDLPSQLRASFLLGQAQDKIWSSAVKQIKKHYEKEMKSRVAKLSKWGTSVPASEGAIKAVIKDVLVENNIYPYGQLVAEIYKNPFANRGIVPSPSDEDRGGSEPR